MAMLNNQMVFISTLYILYQKYIKIPSLLVIGHIENLSSSWAIYQWDNNRLVG